MRKHQNNGRYWIEAAGLFILLLLLLLVNSTEFLYFTDEADNFLAGMSVAAGKKIYVDFTSQHMPLLYYICGLFSMLGAGNMLQFRLYFYVLFAVLWALLYVRNRDRLGVIGGLSLPVLYVMNMIGEYNVCVLSDQLQAFGMAVLFLEFCRYYDIKRIDWKMSVWVAAAILLSFGSAFVSAFGIFAILVGVIGAEAGESRRSHQKLGVAVGHFFRKYALLLALVLVPLLVWVGYYAVTGHLGDMILGAFTLNTKYYPKYSGYGSSTLGAFVDPFVTYGKYFIEITTNLMAHKLQYTKELLCYAVNIVFFVHTFRKSKWQAIVLAVFTVWVGSRGFGSVFHALPYYAVSLCMFASLFRDYTNSTCNAHKKSKNVEKLVGIVFVCGSMLVLALPYVQTIPRIKMLESEWNAQMHPGEDTYEQYLQLLTDKDEDVLFATVDFYHGVNAKRCNLNLPVNVPWTYEAYEEQILETLEEDAPRIMIFNPNYQTWGYELKDYAPEVWNYLHEAYECLYLPSCPELYARKDYYQEAQELCGGRYDSVRIYDDADSQLVLHPGDVLTQSVTGDGEEADCFGLLVNSCADLGGISGTLRVLAGDGTELASCETDFRGWKAEGFYYLETEPVTFEKGKAYTLELTIDSLSEATTLTLYGTQDKNSKTEAAVNGQALAADVCYGLFQVKE
ncbi:MAG: hypothetical protein PUF59_11150 [Lachnospiraceae bacterium]|nr:hypothetical protein [Lachnospiraceae bacterium]